MFEAAELGRKTSKAEYEASGAAIAAARRPARPSRHEPHRDHHHVGRGTEQLRRFKERQKIAFKQRKITDEDWRNREKWKPYELAVRDMISRTSSAIAPWTVVPANDKRLARLHVLETVVQALR